MNTVARLFAVCALLSASSANAESPVLPLPWIKATEFYVTPSPSRIYGPDNAVYIITHGPAGSDYGQQETNAWHTIDLAPFGVPADATAAFLSGLLIITGGTTAEIADLRVVFRRPGDMTSCAKYMGQASFQTNSVNGQPIGGGQRSTMATWVPLAEGKFELCYQLSTIGTWPTNPAYGINLSVQAWTR